MYTADSLFKVMVEVKASDMYISIGSYPMLKVDGQSLPVEEEVVSPKNISELKKELLSEDLLAKYERENEVDFTFSFPGIGRFRINFFRQRGSDAFVARQIINKIKSIAELKLPPIIEDLALEKR